MKTERFVVGPVGTNCYIARNEEKRECFVVDPGACPPELPGHIKRAGAERESGPSDTRAF